MNLNALTYYLGHLAKSTTLSTQCATVRDLMLAPAPSDMERLNRVLHFLDGAEPINDDTVQWLSRGIRGHIGGEGYVLEVSFSEEADFWYTLHRRYPQHAKLLVVSADAAFLAGWSNALELFSQAFTLEPSLAFGLDGGVVDKIRQSKFRLQIELIFLQNAIQNQDEELDQIVADLRADFADDPEALQQIEAALENADENNQ